MRESGEEGSELLVGLGGHIPGCSTASGIGIRREEGGRSGEREEESHNGREGAVREGVGEEERREVTVRRGRRAKSPKQTDHTRRGKKKKER